ncbi:MAG: transposase [Exiguobacterium profundum]|nr:MAG: transposase [Exiguobacterium profundum]
MMATAIWSGSRAACRVTACRLPKRPAERPWIRASIPAPVVINILARRRDPAPQQLLLTPTAFRLRDKFLNEVLFSILADARSQTTACKEDFNHHIPHSALRNIPPAEFATKIRLEMIAA